MRIRFPYNVRCHSIECTLENHESDSSTVFIDMRSQIDRIYRDKRSKIARYNCINKTLLSYSCKALRSLIRPMCSIRSTKINPEIT